MNEGGSQRRCEPSLPRIPASLHPCSLLAACTASSLGALLLRPASADRGTAGGIVHLQGILMREKGMERHKVSLLGVSLRDVTLLTPARF